MYVFKFYITVSLCRHMTLNIKHGNSNLSRSSLILNPPQFNLKYRWNDSNQSGGVRMQVWFQQIGSKAIALYSEALWNEFFLKMCLPGILKWTFFKQVLFFVFLSKPHQTKCCLWIVSQKDMWYWSCETFHQGCWFQFFTLWTYRY